MKKLVIKKLDCANIDAKDIPQMLDNEQIEYNGIECVNWKKDFPYAPKVQFRMAYNKEGILLHYVVEEGFVRAMANGDNGKVWEDACCEFFCSPVNDGSYYNIECNCVGTVLVGFGKTRENRQHAPQTTTSNIKRWSSLGNQNFDIKQAPQQWQLALVIPYTTFFKHDVPSLEYTTIRANFYKCGDKLPQAHFLSWNEINLPRPDFHCPHFFGEVQFK